VHICAFSEPIIALRFRDGRVKSLQTAEGSIGRQESTRILAQQGVLCHFPLLNTQKAVIVIVTAKKYYFRPIWDDR
jgi:hypothetical protein